MDEEVKAYWIVTWDTLSQGSEWRIRPWRSYPTLGVSIFPRRLRHVGFSTEFNNKQQLWPSFLPLMPLSILSQRHVIKIYFTFLLLHSQEKRDRICIIHFYTNLYVLLTAGDSPPFNICVCMAVKQWHLNNTQKMIYFNPEGIAVYSLTPGNHFDWNPFR